MNCKQEAGFTLVELTVGIMLMMLIMSSMAPMFTTLLRHGVHGVDLLDNEQEARWAVNMMARDIRYAKRFNTIQGAGNTMDVVRTDSLGNYMRVRYQLAADPLNNNHLALQRIVNTPVAPVVIAGNTAQQNIDASAVLANASAVLKTQWVGNAGRGFMEANDFIITTKVPGTTVTEVKLEYKIKRYDTDKKQGVAETTIYPLNDLRPLVP